MVYGKRLLIDAGIDLDALTTIMRQFNPRSYQERRTGVYMNIGNAPDYAIIMVRETNWNIILRVSAVIRGGKQVPWATGRENE